MTMKLPTKTYLLKGQTVSYKVPKCPKCNISWDVKMYYFDSDPSHIFSEWYNFSGDGNTNEKIYTKTIQCSKCDFKVETKYEILDEAKVLDAIAKNDEVALRSKELTGPKIGGRGGI